MKTSESVSAIYKALINAQAMIETAKKDSSNPFHKSKYADLMSVYTACKPALVANSLGVTGGVTGFEAGCVQYTTRLIHSSGEWLETTAYIPIADKATAQAVGSAITYGRRYGLASLVGVYADDDDDGNTATGLGKVSKPIQKPVQSEADALRLELTTMYKNLKLTQETFKEKTGLESIKDATLDQLISAIDILKG